MTIDEGEQESSVSGGCVEFVLYALEEVVCTVLEAKTDFSEKGKGQLFLGLHGKLLTMI